MSDLKKSHPEFTIAIRGYDRLQVDEYIQRLHELLDEADERTRTAESELEFSRHMTVGPRVSEIFELAVAEAKEMRERVDEDERTRLAAARQQADALIEEARRAADDLAAQSRREYDEMVADREAERERAIAEVTQLEHQKAQMLADLRRLHDALGSVANLGGLVTDGATDDEERTTRELALEPPVAEQANPEAA
jgi:cell division septum initiation protein DivIVA